MAGLYKLENFESVPDCSSLSLIDALLACECRKFASWENANCCVNVLLIIQRCKETVNVSSKILCGRRQEILLPAPSSWPNKQIQIDSSLVLLDDGQKSHSIKCIFHAPSSSV